jgi:hypothetical protein
MIASRSVVSPCSRFATDFAAGCWLAAGCWVLGAGCGLLAAGSWLMAHGSCWANEDRAACLRTIVMLRPQGVPKFQTAEAPAPSCTRTRQNLFRQPFLGRSVSLLALAHLNIQDHHHHHTFPPPFHPHLTSPPFNPGDALHHHPSISLPRHLLLLLSTPAFDFEGNNVFSTSGSQVLHLLSNFPIRPTLLQSGLGSRTNVD